MHHIANSPVYATWNSARRMTIVTAVGGRAGDVLGHVAADRCTHDSDHMDANVIGVQYCANRPHL
eukprot:6244143-Lingulodinium_polyedra.AAC.1